MTNNLEISRVVPSTQPEPLTNGPTQKLFLGAVVFAKKTNNLECSLFQTTVVGKDRLSAMARLNLILRSECEDYYQDWEVKFKSLYEVTPESPEHFTLTKYFKGINNHAN